MKHHLAVLTSLLLLIVALVNAADRNTKVRNDLTVVEATGHWIYNNLPKGIAQAKQTGKPLLIVFR